MTKKTKPKAVRGKRISVSKHHFPLLSAATWLASNHAQRTETTLQYARTFDIMNGFKRGTSYTFGVAQA